MELSPGSVFVCAMFCVDDNGYYLGHTNRIRSNMLLTLNAIWEDLMKEGIITPAEKKRAVFSNYYRSKQELLDPFEEKNSLAKSLGLILKSFKIAHTPCCYYDRYMQEEKNKVSPEDYAREYVPTTRSWSNSTFMSALDEKRTEMEKMKIVDMLFNRYEKLVAGHPQEFGMDYVHAFLVIQKKVT